MQSGSVFSLKPAADRIRVYRGGGGSGECGDGGMARWRGADAAPMGGGFVLGGGARCGLLRRVREAAAAAKHGGGGEIQRRRGSKPRREAAVAGIEGRGGPGPAL